MTTTSMLRTRWAAVGAAVAITLGAVGLGGLNIASADVSSGDRPVFIPITPCRLMDTRPGVPNVGAKSGPLGPGEVFTATAHGSNGKCTGASAIPTDAVSLALNVTAVGASAATFLTFWGNGANPGTSNLNPRPGAAPTPNSVNTPLSPSGTFNIYNDAGNVNVIVDVNGYYAGHDHDDRYYTEAEASATFATPAQIDAALNVDQIVVGGFDFSQHDPAGTWEFNFLWTHAAGASHCIVAPLDLPAGRSIAGLSIRHVTDSPAMAEVLVVGTIGTAATLTDFAQILHFAAQEEKSLPLSGDATIVETAFAVNPDDRIFRKDFHYLVQVCSADDITFASVVIDIE